MQRGRENVTARIIVRHTGTGMLFVIVAVRFFDYDYDNEHERGNPGAQGSIQEPEELKSRANNLALLLLKS